MSNKSYSGSIALTKLKHVKFKSPKGADCLLIPIDQNLFEVDDNGAVYLPVSVVVRSEKDERGQDGYIFKKIGSEAYKAADEAQREKWKERDNPDTPILGSIKNFDSSANDNSGAMASDTCDEDDLPF